MAYLPCLKVTTDQIARNLSINNIKNIFKPPSKVINLLHLVKDKIPLSTPGVYKIPVVQCMYEGQKDLYP